MVTRQGLTSIAATADWTALLEHYEDVAHRADVLTCADDDSINPLGEGRNFERLRFVRSTAKKRADYGGAGHHVYYAGMKLRLRAFTSGANANGLVQPKYIAQVKRNSGQR